MVIGFAVSLGAAFSFCSFLDFLSSVFDSSFLFSLGFCLSSGFFAVLAPDLSFATVFSSFFVSFLPSFCLPFDSLSLVAAASFVSFSSSSSSSSLSLTIAVSSAFAELLSTFAVAWLLLPLSKIVNTNLDIKIINQNTVI